MATNGVLGTRALLAGVPQAIYVCNNEQATVLTLSVVNKNTVPAKIRVSIGTSATNQGLAEFLEFETELLPKGVLERTGLIVSPNSYLIVKADVSNCNAVCYGVEVGNSLYSNTIQTNTGTTPTWVTGDALGSVVAGSTNQSDSVTLYATDVNSSQLTYTVTGGSLPAGTVLQPNGIITHIKTTTGYTSGAGGQSTSFTATASNGTNSAAKLFYINKVWLDGSTQALAAPSGYWLAQNIGSEYLPSGLRWIKSAKMPNPIQMYVDMTEEGGGYDFYRITGGSASTAYDTGHSGTGLGLDIIYPRSKYHWKALRNYLNNIVGDTGYTHLANVPGIYRTGTTTGNTYVSYPMRSIHYASYIGGQPVAGTYAPDWRVPDGGRWWLRDTTYTEPNGDYTLGGWLGDLSGRNGLPSNYNYQDILFNDGGTYSSGSSYIVSTNAKP